METLENDLRPKINNILDRLVRLEAKRFSYEIDVSDLDSETGSVKQNPIVKRFKTN
jgi:hypothetical protein